LRRRAEVNHRRLARQFRSHIRAVGRGALRVGGALAPYVQSCIEYGSAGALVGGFAGAPVALVGAVPGAILGGSIACVGGVGVEAALDRG
jgi:hypothetical protein